MQDDSSAPDPWWLYVLLCRGDRLYVGIAKDVEARFQLHATGKGAFFTRLNKPVRVLARVLHPSKSAALKAEYALKQRKLEEKWQWIAAATSNIAMPINTETKEDA